MNGNQKFQYEMMSTDELCCVARELKHDIELLKRDIKLFGKEDDSYPAWRDELWDKQRRYRHIIGRIESRQLKMF